MVMISVSLASPSKKIRGDPALSSPSLLLLLLLLLLLSLFLNPVSQIVVSESKIFLLSAFLNAVAFGGSQERMRRRRRRRRRTICCTRKRHAPL
jgi:hypothetical protein